MRNWTSGEKTNTTSSNSHVTSDPLALVLCYICLDPHRRTQTASCVKRKCCLKGATGEELANDVQSKVPLDQGVFLQFLCFFLVCRCLWASPIY